MISRQEFEEFNLELIAARKAIQERDRILDLMAGLDKELGALETERGILARKRHFEQMDVAELENLSIASVLFDMLGRREALLEQQVQELLEVKMAYNQCLRRIKRAQANLVELEVQLVGLADCEEVYATLQLDQKLILLRSQLADVPQLEGFIDQIAENQRFIEEIEEALVHGRQTEKSLDDILYQIYRVNKSQGDWNQKRFELLWKKSAAAIMTLEGFEKELNDIDESFWHNDNPNKAEPADSPFSFVYLGAKLLYAWDDGQRISKWYDYMKGLKTRVASLNSQLKERNRQAWQTRRLLERDKKALIDQMWQPENFETSGSEGAPG